MSTAKKAPKQQRPIEREITIWGCEWGGEEIVDILSQNHAVEDLYIYECDYDGAITSPVISAFFQLKNLTNLDLDDCQLGDTGATEIAKNLVGSNVTTLDLCDNEINDPAMDAFVYELALEMALETGHCVPQQDINYVSQQLIDKWNELGKDPENLMLY